MDRVTVVLVDADQPGGHAGADALGHVGQDGDPVSAGRRMSKSGLPLRSENRTLQVEQRRTRVRWGRTGWAR
jgi:hypothetical protein